MFELVYSKSAVKFLKKLEKKDQNHILSVLERARIRPEAHFERLVGCKSYKIRAGEYRIIADIYNNDLIILVIKVGHRKNIYKWFFVFLSHFIAISSRKYILTIILVIVPISNNMFLSMYGTSDSDISNNTITKFIQKVFEQ